MMNDIKSVLFVCTGNTCRSPLAEVLFNSFNTGIFASSCGISTGGSFPASENSARVSKEWLCDLSGHVSRQITIDMIKNSSLVITMTKSHKQVLNSATNDIFKEKIITLSEFAHENTDVSDPYGGNIETYRQTASMIYDYIKKGLSFLNMPYTHAADKDDLKSIAEIEKACFNDAWSEKSILEETLNKRVLVTKKGSEVLSFCIFLSQTCEGEILKIATSPLYRKNGYAKKLLSYTIDMLHKNGAESIYLEVREGNSPARALYEKLGFLTVGTRKNYYKDNNENAILYKLEIKERL